MKGRSERIGFVIPIAACESQGYRVGVTVDMPRTVTAEPSTSADRIPGEIRPTNRVLDIVHVRSTPKKI